MCLIIDTCVRDLVFTLQPHPDAIPVLDWIEKQNGRAVYGGTKLCDELFKSEHARRRFTSWKRAGRALEIPTAAVDAEAGKVTLLKIAKSNDTHILALARVSGARTLYSTDFPLHEDFKNPRIINHPRGNVYQTSAHIRLLKHTKSCRQ